jgi:hypothetical protein
MFLNPSVDFPVGGFGAIVMKIVFGAVPHLAGVLRLFILPIYLAPSHKRDCPAELNK